MKSKYVVYKLITLGSAGDKALDRIAKKQAAMDRRAEIDAICGYPMKFTKHAVGVKRHPETGDYGLQVATVTNMRKGVSLDIENEILTMDEKKELQEDWLLNALRVEERQ